MTKDEREHIDKVVSLGCICCSMMGFPDSPAEAHHIGNGTMGKRAGNYEVIPLCPIHHRAGGYGIAVHAGRKAFEAEFGTEKELLERVRKLI